MFGFLDRFLSRSEASRDTAKNRLKLVLLQDRSVIPPAVLERIRTEVLSVLQRYVEIDQGALELNFDRSEGSVALLASVPIVRVREDASQLLAQAEAEVAAAAEAVVEAAAEPVAAAEAEVAASGQDSGLPAAGDEAAATLANGAAEAAADDASLASPAGEAALT
ncbi:MAG: cell division topological specificity factor MinE [Candidatus Sericytochromatia bacterium]|nr:cell division topological specificity factor MinE [Candidatus Sericytochromatia bacterium]